jgi:hypothetical protein
VVQRLPGVTARTAVMQAGVASFQVASPADAVRAVCTTFGFSLHFTLVNRFISL